MKKLEPKRSVIVALISLLAASGVQAQDQYQPDETLPGFKANQVYSSSGIDNVNVFSGDPGVIIPIGPDFPLSAGFRWQLKAYYTSKIWSFDQYCSAGGQSQTPGHALINGYPTLGAGWSLDVGYIARVRYGMDPWAWAYRSPEGGTHAISTGIGGPAPTIGLPYLTIDGSLLRITRTAATSYKVEFPDGTVQYFDQPYLRPTPVSGSSPDFTDYPYTSPLDTRYGLRRIIDRFGNEVLTVDYENSSSWKFTTITLKPTGGANATISFSWGQTWTGAVGWPTLTSVTFPAIAGQGTPLTATFQKLAGNFSRNYYAASGIVSTCPADTYYPPTVQVPLLSGIDFSGSDIPVAGYKYGFIYWSATVPDGFSIDDGALREITLPTGGKITYGYWLIDATDQGSPLTSPTPSGPLPNLPPGGRPGYYYYAIDTTAAVVSRVECDPTVNPRCDDLSQNRQLNSITTYSRMDFFIRNPPGTGQINKWTITRRVIVQKPDGNRDGSSQPTTIADRYLFHVSVTAPYFEGGLELEKRSYLTTTSTGTAAKTEVSCYEADAGVKTCGYMSGGSVNAYGLSGNVRLQKKTTYYGMDPSGNGDGSCPALTGSTNSCWERTWTDYNSQAREYGMETVSAQSAFLLFDTSARSTATTWSPLITSDTWLLKRFTQKTVSDTSRSGSCTTDLAPCSFPTNRSYDASEPAFVSQTYTYDPGYGTLRRALTPDAFGNPTGEVISGDSSSLTGSFTNTRTFRGGLVLSNIRTGVAWRSFDVDRDTSTGLITASRDPNNLQTGYTYDALGRLRRVTPPGTEAAASYCYFKWDPSTPSRAATVLSKRGAANECANDDGVPAPGSAAVEAFLYDGFGRISHQIKSLPNANGGSYFAVRRSIYSPDGQVSFQSEWAPCGTVPSATDYTACLSAGTSYGTTISQFDYQGRPQSIVTADGQVTNKRYFDPMPSGGGFDEATAIENLGGQRTLNAIRSDVLGRKLLVTDPGATPPGTPTPWWFGYVGPWTTYRYNVLDKVSKVDVGASGVQPRTFVYDLNGQLRSESHPEKGTTSYTVYNALGGVTSKAEGGLSYVYTYDVLGRLLTAADASGVPSKHYVQNFWDGVAGPAGGYPKGRLTRRIGWNPGVYSSTLISVGEDLAYAGLGGRLSQKTTTISNGAASTIESWTYNSLGLVATESYPRVAPLSGTFAVTTSYRAGVPTAVSASGQAVVTLATYNPAGGVASYTTGNGVTTTIAPDPSLMPRPRRIFTSDGNFNTGYYSYDGAGNILGMGPDTFMYEANSRLLSATYPTGNQTYAYDMYGNLTQKAGVTIGVNPATNRLTSATYDSRGNVTSLAGETYSYDALNRQTKHDAGSSHWSYLLDGANERIVKAIPAGSGFVLRREMARIILQARGDSPRAACAGYFQDVPCTDPDRGWIEKFYELGITAGCSATPRLYCPESTATRAQMAVFISVAMVLPGTVPASGTVSGVGSYNCTTGGTSLFTDVLPTDGTCRFIHYIFANNVTAGCSVSPRSYCPSATTPHWQMEVFVSQAWKDLTSGAGFQYVPPGATYTFRGPTGALLTEYQDSKVSKDYVYLGTRLVGTNQSTGGWQFHSTDHLGSTRLTTNAAGAVVERRKYWPWGEEVSPPGPGRLAFAGMELDLEASRPRYYDHARNLETGNGRFLSPDTLGGKLEDPQSWNRYTYARNNPLKYVDPNGQATELAEKVAGTFEAAGATISGAGVSLNGGSAVGVAVDTALGTLGSVVGGFGDMFRVGDAIGGAIGSGANGDELARAFATDLGRGSALALTLAAPLSGVGGRVPATGEVTTLKPGPFATDSISARGPGRNFTAAERSAIDRIGSEGGCHTCGTTNPGTKSGHFIPDHQPPNALTPPGGAQQLYPHCTSCSFPRQANEVRRTLQELY